jgi:replication-associated recombination protein RarA
MNLSEKHRPSNWQEVIGQPKAVETIQRIKTSSGIGGRAFFISGKSGTGKSSIGKLIAAEIADPFFTEQYNADDVSVDTIRHIEKTMQIYGAGQGGKSGRAFLIEECHGLRKAVIRQLLVLLENIPKHCCIVFTTTIDGLSMFEEGIDANPLLSRCTEIALSQRGLAEAFAKRALEIAQAENLDGRPLADYIRLVNNCSGNMRQVLSKIESGVMLKTESAK